MPFPSAALYPSGTLFPSEAVYPSPPDLTSYRFCGPTTDVYYPLVPPPGHLFGVDQLGVNVFRIDGVWQTNVMLTPEQEASADRLYRGGYVYTLTPDERDELVAAGFADYITAVEVVQ